MDIVVALRCEQLLERARLSARSQIADRCVHRCTFISETPLERREFSERNMRVPPVGDRRVEAFEKASRMALEFHACSRAVRLGNLTREIRKSQWQSEAIVGVGLVPIGFVWRRRRGLAIAAVQRGLSSCLVTCHARPDASPP